MVTVSSGSVLIFAVWVTPLVKLKTNTETSSTLVKKSFQISLDAIFNVFYEGLLR